MATSRRTLVEFAKGINFREPFHINSNRFLFPKISQKPQFSSDFQQIFQRSKLKSNYKQNDWLIPIIDPMNSIVDTFNLNNFINHLTRNYYINNINSVKAFLKNRVIFTTDSVYKEESNNSLNTNNDNVPLTSSITYLNLLDLFTKRSYKLQNDVKMSTILQIFYKMKINNVTLNADMINIMISNFIGNSINDRFCSESSHTKLRDNERYFKTIESYLDIFSQNDISPNKITFLLIYLSFPIDSAERSQLKNFVVNCHDNEIFNNTKEWTEICFLEGIKCSGLGLKNLAVKSLNSIPYTDPCFKVERINYKTFRLSFLKSKFRSKITFETLISSHNDDYNQWLKALKIVNGCILATETKTKNQIFNKYIGYSIHKKFRPSLTGSMGTILLKNSLNWGDWLSFIKCLNYINLIENNKFSWSIIQSSLQLLIRSNFNSLLKLILIKYLLMLVKKSNDSIISYKRWDKLYWNLQDSVDSNFNKDITLWGSNRLLRIQRTKLGFKQFYNELSSKDYKYNYLASFNSNRILKCNSVAKTSGFDNTQMESLKIVNCLNLTGDKSQLNNLISLDLSILTPFETLIMDELSKSKLFNEKHELLLPTSTKKHFLEIKNKDSASNDLKLNLQKKIETDSIWLDEVLEKTWEKWLVTRLSVKKANTNDNEMMK